MSATDSIGTVVIVNRYVSTVRPSEIEIGIPVSIRPNSSAKMIHAFAIGTPASFNTTGMAIITGGRSAGQRGASAGTGATSVLMQLAEIAEEAADVVERVRPLWMPGDHCDLPFQWC